MVTPCLCQYSFGVLILKSYFFYGVRSLFVHTRALNTADFPSVCLIKSVPQLLFAAFALSGLFVHKLGLGVFAVWQNITIIWLRRGTQSVQRWLGWQNRLLQCSTCRGVWNTNDTTKSSVSTCDVCSCHLFCPGLPPRGAYSVLIEVTEGSRAAGSKPDDTVFTGKTTAAVTQ